MTKLVVLPEQLSDASKATLYDQEYEVVDGRFEVSDEVAERVAGDVDLITPTAAYAWKVEDDSPINVGKGKAKK